MEAPASLQEAIDMANDQLKAGTHDLGIPEAKVVAAEPRPKVKEYMEFQRKALVSESWLRYVLLCFSLNWDATNQADNSLNILEAPCIIV